MEESISLEIEKSKSGDPTLKVLYEEKAYYLHSKYSPAREAETWVKEFYEEGKLFVLFGMGLGYHAKALFQNIGKNDRILIIEPYEKIFRVAMESGLVDFLADPRVFICLESDENALHNILRILIQQRFLQQNKIFIAPNYDKIADVDGVEEKLKRAFKDYKVDIYTKLVLACDWQRNYLKNIKYAVQSCPLTEFEHKFTCPIIIVSAGPSLHGELEKLKKIYKHAIILSAGSATATLLKHGVQPHMIVSIDGCMEMFDHLKNTEFEEIPLCYAPINHYKIAEKHTGAKIIFQPSSIRIMSWYNSVIGFETGIVNMAPSVANFCLDIACRMTSGPVCFVGQDLAFVGGFTHAQGNDQRLRQEDFKQKILPVVSNDGSELYTEYGLVLMREWFEKYLYVNPRKNIYNTSLRGAKIAGTSVIEFEKFIDEYCQEQIDGKQIIEDIVGVWNTENFNKKKDSKVIIKELLISVENVIATTKIANDLSEKLLNKIKKQDDKNINKLLTQLSKLDKKIMTLKDKDGLLFLIVQLVIDALILWDEEDEDEHKKKIKIAAKGYFLYNRLHSMACAVKEILDEEIQS